MAEQVKRSSVRNRTVEGDEQMSEKGENGYKGGARETQGTDREKNTLNLNKEQVREGRGTM